MLKVHPPSFYNSSLPTRETYDGRGKTLFLYLAAQGVLYLFDRGCEITEKESGERGGNILFKKMIHGPEAVQLMSQQCTVGVFGVVFSESVYQ